MRSRVLCAVLFLLPASLHAWRMSAWIPSWDGNALAIMQTRAGNLSEANPVWYTIARDGSVVKTWNAEDPAMRAALTGTLLVPTIQNYVGGAFDGAAVAALIAAPASRNAHADTLANLATNSALDGIDLDYESIPTASRANFTAFVEVLAQKLHDRGKLLSVTVHARTSDGGAQDWIAIGRAADSVKIMAYDYHWDTSAAGPLAPLDWLDAVATYAERTDSAGPCRPRAAVVRL